VANAGFGSSRVDERTYESEHEYLADWAEPEIISRGGR
jgi:hypothetical protein